MRSPNRILRNSLPVVHGRGKLFNLAASIPLTTTQAISLGGGLSCVRQSSMGQVRNHRERTERQNALQELAKNLGWPVTRIVVFDGDRGKSGTPTTERENFKTLVADVSLGKAGSYRQVVDQINQCSLSQSNINDQRFLAWPLGLSQLALESKLGAIGNGMSMQKRPIHHLM